MINKSGVQNIAIIGYGYVGKAVANYFKDHYNLFIYDPYYLEANAMGERLEDKDMVFTMSNDEINSCDLAVVCVPTGMAEGGAVDLSAIESTIDWLNTPLILFKSTVPPGTVDKLVETTGKAIAFSPEYIGEGKYVVQWWKDKGYPHPTDMKFHDFQIFGGLPTTTSGVLQFFKKVTGPEVKYLQTDAKTAELTKYMENSWGAMKVTFCNEFYEIAKTFGVDYDELRELWLMDGRVERMHTAVFKKSRGFGGKCYPKDVNGIIYASEKAGYEPKLLKQVIDSNEEFVNLSEVAHDPAANK